MEELDLDEASCKLSYFERIKKRIKKRSPAMIGGSIGAAIGSLGGPGSAVFGAGVGGVIAEEIEDILQRNLSEKEKERLIIARNYAIKKYIEKIDAGFEPRDDNFVIDSPISRSSAKEIVEGLYISAKTDHEERKLPYYGNLMANILFESEYDRYQANLLIRVFEGLSYRQLCILALIVHKDEFELRKTGYDGGVSLDSKLVYVLQEIDGLNSQGLVGPCGSDIFGILYKPPASMVVQGTGEDIYKLAELKDIYRKDYDELESIAELLR